MSEQLLQDGELLYRSEEVTCSVCNECRSPARRVAVIPYIMGRKYTIGSHFITREDKVEPIFYDDMYTWGSGLSKNVEGHCQILCSVLNGKPAYFITALEDEQGTIVNGQVVRKGSLVKLNFGDTVRLGKKARRRRRLIELVPSDLYFRAALYGMPPDLMCLRCRDVVSDKTALERKSAHKTVEETEEASETECVLGNIGLIIQRILDYLPIPDLKRARLVSHIWKDEATILLKKKTEVQLNLRHDLSKSLFLYEHQMSQFQHPSWKLNLTTYIDEFDDYYLKTSTEKRYDAHALAKVDSDILNYFHTIGMRHQYQYLTNLSVKVALHTTKEHEVVFQILKGTSGSLESLRICLEIYQAWVSEETLESLGFFPVLNNLEFQLSFYNECQDKFWTRGLSRVIKTSRKLNALTMKLEDEETMQTLLANLPYNITSLTLDGSMYEWTKDIGKSLLAIPNGQLRILNMRLMPEMKVGFVSSFLRNHSTSLEKLCLSLKSTFCYSSAIKFPSMRMLKMLEISAEIEHDEQDGCDEEDIELFVFPDCPGGVLMYEENFPKLQALSVWPPTAEVWRNRPKIVHDVALDYVAFVRPFFPSQFEQICKTVVHMDVPYFWMEGENQEVRFTKGIDVKKLTEMFPNTVFPEYEAAIVGWKKELEETRETLKKFEMIPWDEWTIREIGKALRKDGPLGRIRQAIKELEETMLEEMEEGQKGRQIRHAF